MEKMKKVKVNALELKKIICDTCGKKIKHGKKYYRVITGNDLEGKFNYDGDWRYENEVCSIICSKPIADKHMEDKNAREGQYFTIEQRQASYPSKKKKEKKGKK